MSIKKWIEQARMEGRAQNFVVYANVGNNSDELIVCTADEADAAGASIIYVEYIEHSAFMRTAVITAEVK